jgi:hypothetical protein
MPEFNDRLINVKYREILLYINLVNGTFSPLHTLKAYEVEVQLQPFLTSTLDRGGWLASFTSSFIPGTEVGWGPKAVWMFWKRENSLATASI